MPKHTVASLKEIPYEFHPDLEKIIIASQTNRGEESVQKVLISLASLKGVVTVIPTTTYSKRDRYGIDMQITITTHTKQENRFGKIVAKKVILTFPLQIKSSVVTARNFISKHPERKIPVLVHLPGATTEEIINAFGRLLDKYKSPTQRKNGIIEIAGEYSKDSP